MFEDSRGGFSSPRIQEVEIVVTIQAMSNETVETKWESIFDNWQQNKHYMNDKSVIYLVIYNTLLNIYSHITMTHKSVFQINFKRFNKADYVWVRPYLFNSASNIKATCEC